MLSQPINHEFREQNILVKLEVQLVVSFCIVILSYYFQMKNKTLNKFRVKQRPYRQTYVSVDLPKNQSSKIKMDSEGESFIAHDFSSQYLSLARRFKIKVLPDRNGVFSDKSGKNQEQENEQRRRMKTQLSRNPKRYNIQSPLGAFLPKPHSVSINVPPSTNRVQHLPFFNHHLHRQTAYSTQLPKPRINKQLHILGEEPKTAIKLASKDQLGNLANHCKKLFKIKKLLSEEELLGKQVIKQIKQYVLRQQACSISKLDRAFDGIVVQKQIKKLISLERASLVSIICNFIGGKLPELREQSHRVVEICLGFWFQIMSNTYRENIYQLQTHDSQIKSILNLLSDAKLMTKSSLHLLNETLAQKLIILFKNSRDFYEKVKDIIGISEQLSINRAFYELLTHSATYFTAFQSKHQANIDSISFFATCPSPYFIKPSTKAKSLVIDLDGTLLYSKSVKKSNCQYDTLYRPGCNEFVQDLSQHYEIIIFTTSLEPYAREVTKNIKGIDHMLFRQHAVRMKHGFVKDLSRLGRDLKKLIILDDLSSNFKLQKQNGVQIKSWKGQQGDCELAKVKQFLLKVTNTDDVKSELQTYRSEFQKKRVSFANSPHSPKNDKIEEPKQNKQ